MKLKDNDMKYAKQKFKQNLILITYENMNIKWNNQNYGSRL
jgi:hypothetical protein